MKNITPQTKGQEEFERQRRFYANGMGGLPIVGDPDHVAKTLAELSHAGLTGIGISLINYLDELPFFCDEVLPRLERMGLREKRRQRAIRRERSEAMKDDDDDRPKKKITHEIGQDLASAVGQGTRGAHRTAQARRSRGWKPRSPASRRRAASRIRFSRNERWLRSLPAPQRMNRTVVTKFIKSLNSVIKLSPSLLVIVHLLDIEWLLSTLFDASLFNF